MSYAQAVEGRRVISIGKIAWSAKAKDVEKAVKGHGFSNATFYWAYQPDGVSHKGWVQIGLPDQKVAQQALSKLKDLTLNGKPIEVKMVSRAYDQFAKPAATQAKLPSPKATTRVTGSTPPKATTPAPATSTAPTKAATAPIPTATAAPAKALTHQSGYDKELASKSLTKHPPGWILDPEKPDLHLQLLFTHYTKLESAYAKAGVQNGFRVAMDRQGGRKFHSRQYPSPSVDNNEAAKKVWVVGTKENANAKRQWEYVATEDIPGHEAEGWLVWDRPEYPVNKDDLDIRKLNFTCDVQTTDAPHRDTEKLFADELKFLRDAGLNLQAKSTNTANPSLSISAFRPPAEVTVLDSYTTSHNLIHKHPAGTGAGWGGFDKFQQWQGYGRQVKQEMVEKKPFAKETKMLTFVSDDLMFFDDLLVEADEKYPIVAKEGTTLWDRVNKDKGSKGAPGSTDLKMAKRRGGY